MRADHQRSPEITSVTMGWMEVLIGGLPIPYGHSAVHRSVIARSVHAWTCEIFNVQDASGTAFQVVCIIYLLYAQRL